MYERLTTPARDAILKELPTIDQALGRILGELDLTEHACSSCGANRKHAYRDAQLAETLRGMRRKLGVWQREALSAGAEPLLDRATAG